MSWVLTSQKQRQSFEPESNSSLTTTVLLLTEKRKENAQNQLHNH